MYQPASRIFLYMRSLVSWDYPPEDPLSDAPESPENAGPPIASDGDGDILSLAAIIKTHAETLARYATERNVHPSLAANGDTLKIAATDTGALRSKADLLYALKSLQSLIKGPLGILMDTGVRNTALSFRERC